jgi:adenylate cyclase
VAHVLEGSLREAGDRIRITTQLVDTSSGHVWADRYDRDLGQALTVPDAFRCSRACVISSTSRKKPAVSKRPANRKRAPRTRSLGLGGAIYKA